MESWPGGSLPGPWKSIENPRDGARCLREATIAATLIHKRPLHERSEIQMAPKRRSAAMIFCGTLCRASEFNQSTFSPDWRRTIPLNRR